MLKIHAPRNKTAIADFSIKGKAFTQTMYFAPNGKVYIPATVEGGGLGGNEYTPGKTTTNSVKIKTPKGVFDCRVRARAVWLDLVLFSSSTMECTSTAMSTNGTMFGQGTFEVIGDSCQWTKFLRDALGNTIGLASTSGNQLVTPSLPQYTKIPS